MEPVTRKDWQIQPRISPEADKELAAYPPFLRQILFNRGYFDRRSAEAYLNAETLSQTDPFLISGMGALVERLEHAIERGEEIAVYGDYDVDGVTATALLVEVITALGGRARENIPNRFDEGYGLNNDALDALHEAGVKLVITVDCGIRSLAEARHARKIGIDLAISDHHQPATEFPEALAVICPKQPGDLYPDKNLAGVGLAYKIAQALLSRKQAAGAQVEDWLDLVALGTVADLAPLVGENRMLVRAGLNRIRQPRRQGLISLAGAAGLAISSTTATDIGFILGPRLNAAGRLESALAAYHLLMTSDVSHAGELAQRLERQNAERQQLTRETQARAEQLALKGREDAILLFAVDPGFNPGIVGLAASRLSEAYYRPSVVGALGDEFTRASCRSIPEFHITEALDQCSDLLERHGGHAAAAGFTVRNENLAVLAERLDTIAREQIGHRDLRPVLTADLEISLRDLKPIMMEELDKLQPTGYGNPDAIFISRGLKVIQARAVGKDGKHLKLSLSDDRITYDGIAFRMGDRLSHLPARIDVMYTFERNDYLDRRGFQLRIKDIRPSQGEI